MSRTAGAVLLLALMVAVIISVDFLFLRDRFGLRLIVNVCVVAVAVVMYLAVLRH